jgi:hypothetical protein
MSSLTKPVAHQSTVVITAKLPSGKVISQELPIPHAPGVQDFQLIDQAIKTTRAVGGLMGDSDEPDAIKFYPLMMLTDGLSFKVKRVTLAVSGLA